MSTRFAASTMPLPARVAGTRRIDAVPLLAKEPQDASCLAAGACGPAAARTELRCRLPAARSGHGSSAGRTPPSQVRSQVHPVLRLRQHVPLQRGLAGFRHAAVIRGRRRSPSPSNRDTVPDEASRKPAGTDATPCPRTTFSFAGRPGNSSRTRETSRTKGQTRKRRPGSEPFIPRAFKRNQHRRPLPSATVIYLAATHQLLRFRVAASNATRKRRARL